MKKQLFILVIFSFSCIATQGQSANEIDTLEVFKASKKVPKRFSKDSKILANRLCKDFNDDARKVMAISFWISQNIRYDYRAFLSRTYLSTSSRHTLKNRSALCGGYAQLFKEMCQAVGVKCEVVHGYTKDFDFFPDDDFYRAEHAWTLVKIDGEWNAIDLTWASSQIVRRRQWLAKFFYKLFKWDYDTKYKAKRIFNSDWLYVPAEEFIYSHLPISDAFQMLSSPVSIEDFQLGDSAIYEHITTTSCVQEESPELEAFNSISDFDQWHYLANKSHDFNQLNYRDPAFYLTLVADSLHRKFGEEDPKILKGSVKDLDSLYALCNKIDTLIFKASEGYVREYYTYENRSNRWLMKTKEKNKSIRFRMSERSKLNSKQVKLVKKTAYKNKSHSRYASSISRKKKKNLLVKIDRATEATSEDSLTNLKLLQVFKLNNDSLAGILKMKDSLFACFSAADREIALLTETKVYLDYEQMHSQLKTWINVKTNQRPSVYFTDYPTEKEWLTTPLELAHRENLLNTDSLISGLYKHQNDTYDLMKRYRSGVKKQLSLIKKIKKNSKYDLGEDSLYIALLESIPVEFKAYEKQIESFLNDQKVLTDYLNDERKILRRMSALLRRDDIQEKRRHSSYSRYRKRIQSAENIYLKLLERKIEVIQKAYHYTLRHRGLEKE